MDKFYEGIIAVIAAAMGGLGMVGAMPASPVIAAPISVAHMSTTSSVDVSNAHVAMSVNGRECRVDAKGVASVRVVSNGSRSYIEITDKHGRMRRVNC
jgi:hypothetical protein